MLFSAVASLAIDRLLFRLPSSGWDLGRLWRRSLGLELFLNGNFFNLGRGSLGCRSLRFRPCLKQPRLRGVPRRYKLGPTCSKLLVLRGSYLLLLGRFRFVFIHISNLFYDLTLALRYAGLLSLIHNFLDFFLGGFRHRNTLSF